MLPEDIRQLLVNIERIRNSNDVEIYDTIRIRKGGELIHLEIMLSPVKNDVDEVIGVSTIARDITARAIADAALRNSEEKFRALVLKLPLVSTRLTWTTTLYSLTIHCVLYLASQKKRL